MSWNLPLQLNNLYAAVKALQASAISNPVAASLRINAPATTTTYGITDCASISASTTTGTLVLTNFAGTAALTINSSANVVASGTLTAGTLTGGSIAASNTSAIATGFGISVDAIGVINITLTTATASNFLLGQTITIAGTSNAVFNGISPTITVVSPPSTLATSNPTSIAPFQLGGGGTITGGGSITARDLTAQNLNGKLSIVGQTTSTAGNVLYTANTTNTTGNYDLLTDSAEHFKFTGGSGAGSNTLTIGGATYGGITIPSTSGIITANRLSSNAASALQLESGSNLDVNILAGGTGAINLTTNSVARATINSAGINTNNINHVSGSSLTIGNASTTALTLASSGTTNGSTTINSTGTGAVNLNYAGSTLGSVGSKGMRTDGNTWWWSFSAGSTSALSPNTNRVLLGNIYGGAAVGAHLGDFSNWALLYLTDAVNQSSSDGRYKENIVDANLEMCYDTIERIRLRRYNWIEGNPRTEGIILKDKNLLGVIAQELEEVLPKSVYEKPLPNSNEIMKTINTDQLYFSLLGCVQSLQKKTETQQAQITSLQAQLKALAEATGHLVI